MSDPVAAAIAIHWKTLLAAGVSLVVAVWGIVKMLLTRAINQHDVQHNVLEQRVDSLENEKVSRQEFNQTVASLRHEIQTSKTEIREDLANIRQDLNEQLNRGITTLSMFIAKNK